MLADGAEIAGERLLLAVGRSPTSTGLGLDLAALAIDPDGYPVTNDQGPESRTCR